VSDLAVIDVVRSDYMGHSITITLDRYGHLLPGNEDQAATLLEAWLHSAKQVEL
jgi:hypothetical protein